MVSQGQHNEYRNHGTSMAAKRKAGRDGRQRVAP